MHHVKDCIVNAEHAALRDITRPYKSLAWTTALAIVRERMEGAYENYKQADMGNAAQREYRKGRYEALLYCLAEMEERGKP